MENVKNKLTAYENDFFNNLRNYIDKPIYFYGSIQRDDYFPQMSDIDIDIFSDNELSIVVLLQNYLNLNKDDFKRSFYKMDKTSTVVLGYKTKYIDNNLNVEISIYNEKYKDEILMEHQSKFNLPIYITFILILLKILHYKLGVLSLYYYSRIKKQLINCFYDNNEAMFFVLNG